MSTWGYVVVWVRGDDYSMDGYMDLCTAWMVFFLGGGVSFLGGQVFVFFSRGWGTVS